MKMSKEEAKIILSETKCQSLNTLRGGAAWEMVLDFNGTKIQVSQRGSGGPNRYYSPDRETLENLKAAAEVFLGYFEPLDKILANTEKGETCLYGAMVALGEREEKPAPREKLITTDMAEELERSSAALLGIMNGPLQRLSQHCMELKEDLEQKNDEIARLAREHAKLQKQLDHERGEREAAQRTIARLGGYENSEQAADESKEEEGPYMASCSRCDSRFNAWGYTFDQRAHGRVYCDACIETSRLKAWASDEAERKGNQ